MKLLLIRHGQTHWNQEKRIQGWHDSPLTPCGVEQLRCLPLPKLNNPQMFSSDLGRAHGSAMIIADRLGVDVMTDRRLRERRFGELEGRIIDQDAALEAQWQAYHQRYQHKLTRVANVEAEHEFEQRIRAFIVDNIQANDDCDVVIVSHGEWLRAFSNVLQGIPSWHCGQGIGENAQITTIERFVESCPY